MNLGYFEFRKSHPNSAHIFIGVPRGASEPVAIDFASAIRYRVDAGLVVAYDFDKSRIVVSQPLTHTSQISSSAPNGVGRSSVYAQFRTLLRTPSGAD